MDLWTDAVLWKPDGVCASCVFVGGGQNPQQPRIVGPTEFSAGVQVLASGCAQAVRVRWPRPAWSPEPVLRGGLLVGTGLLYLVGLGRSSWGNSFYAAAVQAG